MHITIVRKDQILTIAYIYNVQRVIINTYVIVIGKFVT